MTTGAFFIGGTMEYKFIKNKDGHKMGERIELEPSNWFTFYWTKKRVIVPVHREEEVQAQEPEIEAQEPKAKTRKRK